MPHARQWKAAEIRALGPLEHDEAVAALKEARQTGLRLSALVGQEDIHELDLGKLMADIFDKDWCRAVAGKTTEEWVRENLVGRDGHPMGKDSAQALARDWRAISRFPKIEALLRKGGDKTGRFTCRTAAYYACETAIVAEWVEDEIKSFLAVNPLTEENIEAARDMAMDVVQERLIKLLKKRSSSQLRDDFYSMKKEMGLMGDGAKKHEWEQIKGGVVKEVKRRFDELIARLQALHVDEDPLDVAEMTLTQQYERVAEFGHDALDAIEEAIAGNELPLQSFLEQAKAVRVAKLASE